MANLHIEWMNPYTNERMIRCSIPDTATDEVLAKVLKSEREVVGETWGEEVAATIRWRNDTNWKNRERRNTNAG